MRQILKSANSMRFFNSHVQFNPKQKFLQNKDRFFARATLWRSHWPLSETTFYRSAFQLQTWPPWGATK